jgi:hypothetical protein
MRRDILTNGWINTGRFWKLGLINLTKYYQQLKKQKNER